MPIQGSRSGRALRRSLSASVAVAIAASLLAAPTSALAATVTARDLDSACPEGDVPRAGFDDTIGNAFEREIDCIVGYGIARGTSTHTFDPRAEVTRGQMASFLANTLTATGRTRPRDLPNAFRDDDGTSHEANIDWLAAEGVLGGFGDGTYRPGVAVTRGQMATFLNNLVREVTGSRLTSSTDHFLDDDDTPHEANIDGLASRGIVTGTGDDRYSPHDPVTRQQMGGFLAREADHLVDEGHLDMPFGPERLAVEPATAARYDTSDNASSSTADRGARTYTVSVPIGIERVHIALFPAESVSVASDGTPRFASNATIAANAGTSIETVNAATVDLAGGSTDVVRVNDVAVRDDQVFFRVDSTVVNAVVPVVWTDTIEPSQDRLDLEAGASTATPKSAREIVAVGGAQSWGPVEPARGTNLGVGTVREVNVSAGWYTLDTAGGAAADHLLRFAAADSYSYTASAEPKAGSPGPITHAQFQTWIGVGDKVDPSAYDPGKMTHVVTGDVPATPTNIAAVVQSDGKVKVTWTKPSNPVADDAVSSYRLERAVVTGGTVGTFAEVASAAGNATPEIINIPPAAGTYAYRVVARSLTGNSPATNAVQVSVTAPAPATTGILLTDVTPKGTITKGDEIRLTFDRAVTASGWWIELLDVNGTRFRLDNLNSALSGNGTAVVTVTVDKVPTALNATGDLVPETATFLQIVAAAGIGNATGGWNLPKSGVNDAGRMVVGAAPSAPGGDLRIVAGTRRLDAGTDEVQVISKSTATAGTWTLSLDGETSDPLAFDASPAMIEAELEKFIALEPADVTVEGPAKLTDGPMTVSFGGAKVATDVAELVIAAGTPTGAAPLPTVTTTVIGKAATGIVAGDVVSVFTLAGTAAAGTTATAGINGRTTVTLSAATVGQQFYVVVQKADGRYTRTAVVTAS